ncbi:MAG: alpha-N-acetylgalactosaminidase, partial [Winogradskyella sp.]|nr:alpha-N-acetylgalactosaminidase [Winogradskyella sp.]
MKRRHFLKTTSLSLTGVAVASVLPNCTYESKDRPLTSHYMGGFAAPKLDTVRAAFIGVGARGGYHMKFFAELPGTEVVAISDLYEDNVTKWGTIANEIGKGERHQNVKLYHGEEDLWRIMLDEVKPDIVFI